MNQVDYLLKTQFSSLNFAQQVEVKRSGPHQPADFKLEVQDGKRTRSFTHSWFLKHTWLTVSIEKQSLFCYYCLLFNPNSDNTWAKTGCTDLKHMTERIKKHEESPSHLTSALRYKTFGLQSTYFEMPNCKNELKVKTQTHNEKVSKNRHVFGKIIDCMLFCAVHEISFEIPGNFKRADVLGNHDERGSFLDMLSMMSNTDSLLADHLSSRYGSKYTTPAVQTDILACVHRVYLEDLKKDVTETKFVALQVDKISETVGGRRKFAIVLRFIKGTQPVDRFVACVEVDHQLGPSLHDNLINSLQQFNLKDKLIAQSYRGTDVGAVPKTMMTAFPHAKGVYSYDNDVESLIRSVCSSISSVKLFFINISRFERFFAGSMKRVELLRLVCRENQNTDPLADTPNKWNFQSETVMSVYNFKTELCKCFENIVESEWDEDTIREASALMMLLKHEDFLCFLDFFRDVLPLVSSLRKKLHYKTPTSQEIVKAIAGFETDLFHIRKNANKYVDSLKDDGVDYAPSAKRRRDESKEKLTDVVREACDMILQKVQDHFRHTTTFYNLSFIHPKEFTPKKLSTEDVNNFSSNYSFLNVLKLGYELLAIYDGQLKETKNVSKLLEFFVDHDLMDSFSETYDVIRMAITIPAPVFPGHARRFDTLDKIKVFCQNNADKDGNGMNTLILCSIHKDVISGTSDFNNRVMDEFADLKDLGSELKFI